VRLLDLGLVGDRRIDEVIRECLEPITGRVFVGVTATTATYQQALAVLRTVKRLDRRHVTILGGHHVSAQDRVVLEHHDTVDCVVRGEGERAVAALLADYPRLDTVPNLSYRDGLEICRNPSGPLLDQDALDRIPPSFHGWGVRSAPGKFEHTTYVSARGCPLRCAFCAVSNQAMRAKSIDAVIGDLRELVGTMGFRKIAIEDNFFAHSPARTLQLCRALRELREELPFDWDCQTRVESCRREDVLEAMERAGCEAVYLGVESLDVEQLLYLRKTRSPGRYLNMLQDQVVPWLLQSTIKCYLNLQLGLPGEGPSHREATLERLEQLGRLAVERDREITVFPQLHVVYPGTAHFQQGLTEGRFGPGGESVFERFTVWEARQQPVLRWLGENFAHGTGGIPEGILRSDRLAAGEFDVDADAVLGVVNYLDAIAGIKGIRVFRYGEFLAQEGDRQGTEDMPEILAEPDFLIVP